MLNRVFILGASILRIRITYYFKYQRHRNVCSLKGVWQFRNEMRPVLIKTFDF